MVLAYSRPLVLEAALQARSLQRDEAQKVAEGLGAVLGCLVCMPRWSKKDMGATELVEAVPELTGVFPRGNRWFGLLRDKRSPHYAEEPTFCEKFGIPSFKDLDEFPGARSSRKV